jgi:hypothetical protein
MFLVGRSVSLTQLDEEQLRALSPGELAQRMDLVLHTADEELYGADVAKNILRPSLQDFLASKLIESREHQIQKEALFLGWEFVCQMAIILRLSGFANHLIYNEKYHENLSWTSPTNHLRNAVIAQSEIVLSRAAFDRLMNLIYYVITNKSLEGGSAKKSKKAVFFRFLNDADWNWRYFLYIQTIVNSFDDKIRTGEVHKKSRILRQIVRLSRPDDSDLNRNFTVSNLMHNLWQPLLEILNGNSPSTVYGDPSLLRFLEILRNQDRQGLQIFAAEQSWMPC